MGIGELAVEVVLHAKQAIQRRSSWRRQSRSPSNRAPTESEVPKGHFAIYVGVEEEEKKRFVIPIGYLKHPMFQHLLGLAEDEFGFDHRMGGLTIPCSEHEFLNRISRLD